MLVDHLASKEIIMSKFGSYIQEAYDELIHKVKKDVVMFFHAPWCGHCKVSLWKTMMDYCIVMYGGMI